MYMMLYMQYIIFPLKPSHWLLRETVATRDIQRKALEILNKRLEENKMSSQPNM